MYPATCNFLEHTFEPKLLLHVSVEINYVFASFETVLIHLKEPFRRTQNV